MCSAKTRRRGNSSEYRMFTSIKCYVNCNNTSALKFCIAIQTYSNHVKSPVDFQKLKMLLESLCIS